MSNWQMNLETVGAEIFQRYRKRLLLPGITMEIRQDYPGLSLPDVLIRVHAGRQIIRGGDDFRALELIRSGCWQRIQRQNRFPRGKADGPGDRLSRFLVVLGGALFAGFCLLSLLASWSGGAGVWAPAALVLAFAAGLIGRRALSRPAPRENTDAPGCTRARRQLQPNRNMPASV